MIALVHQPKQDTDQAKQDCNRALCLEPAYTRASVTRSDLDFKRDPDQAIRDCNKALWLDQRSSRAYHQRGLVHAPTGRENWRCMPWTKPFAWTRNKYKPT